VYKNDNTLTCFPFMVEFLKGYMKLLDCVIQINVFSTFINHFAQFTERFKKEI